MTCIASYQYNQFSTGHKVGVCNGGGGVCVWGGGGGGEWKVACFTSNFYQARLTRNSISICI